MRHTAIVQFPFTSRRHFWMKSGAADYLLAYALPRP
jgi:hypothetical protein